jgi:hypothetical protein
MATTMGDGGDDGKEDDSEDDGNNGKDDWQGR